MRVRMAAYAEFENATGFTVRDIFSFNILHASPLIETASNPKTSSV